MEIIEILGLLFCHWIGDFVLQSDRVAKGKSKNNMFLLTHATYYVLPFVIFLLLYQVLPYLEYNENYIRWSLTKFIMITVVLHFIQDYVTSRINSYLLYSKGQIHNFYVSLGFDQFLHFCQLILTYYFIFKI